MRACIFVAASAVLVLSFDAGAQEPPAEGAAAYRACAACHSLRPDIHLTGPSLAGIWGKPVATVAGYDRYTAALRAMDFVWNEDALNAWLADPQAMVPGTTMVFPGIDDDQARADLIAFLRLALAEGGVEQVVADGLIPESMADGQIPPSLKTTEPQEQVAAIRHCGDAFHVTLATGDEYPFWETNVRLKVDSSERGPQDGSPVLLRSGMAGDRISIVFSGLAELKTFIVEQC